MSRDLSQWVGRVLVLQKNKKTARCMQQAARSISHTRASPRKTNVSDRGHGKSGTFVFTSPRLLSLLLLTVEWTSSSLSLLLLPVLVIPVCGSLLAPRHHLSSPRGPGRRQQPLPPHPLPTHFFTIVGGFDFRLSGMFFFSSGGPRCGQQTLISIYV